MIAKLIEMYENGSLTGYQVMIDCVLMLDSSNPGIILAELPGEILDEMWEYTRRYDPTRPRSASLVLPSKDQVRAAERWIQAHHARRSESVKP